MGKTFTGVQVVESVDPQAIDELYTKAKSVAVGRVPGLDGSLTFPHSFVVLKSDGRQSALARVSASGQELLHIGEGTSACDVKPRNKEQAMVLSTLMDDKIPVQVIAGRAGTGKTLLTLAAAMQQVETGVYDKIILTKPMSQVGEYDIGILPGGVMDKFAPFLINYSSNIEQLLGGHELKKEERRKGGDRRAPSFEQQQTALQGLMADFIRTYNVEVIPVQLLRGASFSRAFIIADEIQVLGHHEMLTIGTRVAAGSKLVLMGDLDQRDEKIAVEKTGLHKVIHDPKMQASKLVSYIELRKVERGPVAELFANVF